MPLHGKESLGDKASGSYLGFVRSAYVAHLCGCFSYDSVCILNSSTICSIIHVTNEFSNTMSISLCKLIRAHYDTQKMYKG